MIIITPTNSEIAAGNSAQFIDDDYHLCLRQLRSTHAYFRDYILRILDGLPIIVSGVVTSTTFPIDQVVALKIQQHINVVHFRPDARSSITNRSTNQQATARLEHNDPTYVFDSDIASIQGDFQSLWSIATDIMVPYEPETLLTNGETVSLRLRVNNILGNY